MRGSKDDDEDKKGIRKMQKILFFCLQNWQIYPFPPPLSFSLDILGPTILETPLIRVHLSKLSHQNLFFDHMNQIWATRCGGANRLNKILGSTDHGLELED